MHFLRSLEFVIERKNLILSKTILNFNIRFFQGSLKNVTIRVVFQNFFIYAIFQIRKTKMMFTRPVSNSDITDFIIDRLDNVKTPDCHVYSKNFLDYTATIHKVSFAKYTQEGARHCRKPLGRRKGFNISSTVGMTKMWIF